MTKVFKSHDEWRNFCRYIINTNRYVLSSQWKEFIDTVLSTAAKRETFLKEGTNFVRARIGSHYEEREDQDGGISIDYGPLGIKDMEAPPPDKAIDGRINPRGISYLYLSNDIETAILEVRSWLGQDVSVGYFILSRNLKCIDTSRDKARLFFYMDEKTQLTPEIMEKHVWGSINESFSRPVTPGDEHSSYIPTQYLSECFKTAGYDGIIYKSAHTKKGYNIVLFNPVYAHLEGARVFQIKSMKPIFEICGNPYSCKTAKKQNGEG